MKLFKTTIFILAISLTLTVNAQDTETTSETTLDKTSYYKKRAAEDAKYEQQFKAENKSDDEAFWEDQKAYEKNLKKSDKKSYRAYMKGKKDAYAEHYNHCDNHCHHSDHYYHHASFYYYGYNNYYYENRSNRNTSINTRVRISKPNLKAALSLF